MSKPQWAPLDLTRAQAIKLNLAVELIQRTLDTEILAFLTLERNGRLAFIPGPEAPAEIWDSLAAADWQTMKRIDQEHRP